MPTTVQYDTENLFNWDSRETLTTDLGILLSTLTVYDNGISLFRTTKASEFGLSEERVDVNDVANWASISISFYEGQRTSRVTTYDNDIVRVEEWDLSGERSETRQFDNSNVVDWTSIGTYFSDGIQVAKVTEYDNGVSRVEEWENGLRSVTQQTDLHDVKTWDHIATYYEAGVKVAHVTTYDNGVSRVEEYENGARSVTQESDLQDVKAWDHIATYYDAQTGEITQRNYAYDDGVQRVDLYNSSGARAATFKADVEDTQNWSEQITGYFENGTKGLHETSMDSGDRIVFRFQEEDGQKDWRLEIDGDSSDDWAFRVTEYDVDGQNPVVTTYDAANELPMPYVDYTGLVAEV